MPRVTPDAPWLAAVWSWALLLVAGLAWGCAPRSEAGTPFRIGYQTNVTHAQALVGGQDGTFARALGGSPVELRLFSSGPPTMQALLAGEIDLAYVGGAPALLAHVRSERRTFVVAGAVSGGAVFVVRPELAPTPEGEWNLERLRDKTFAAPQIANMQDVTLRHWLAAHGLGSAGGERGPRVIPLANSDIVTLFSLGKLDGAWVPEPWGATLVHQAGGVIALVEQDLWPEGRAPITVLAASVEALTERSAELEAVLRAHEALTRRWQADPASFSRAAGDAILELTGKSLAPEVFADAFSRLEPTLDPMKSQLLLLGERMKALGYLPEDADLSGVVDAPMSPEGDPP